MKKTINTCIIFCCMLIMISILKAIPVTLPSTEILNKRLKKMGLQSFLDQTKIDEELGTQRTDSSMVVWFVKHSLEYYAQQYQSSMMTAIMHIQEQAIIKAILKDSPAAISDLENIGFLVKSRKSL